jgi:hypothetical protein
MVTTTIALDDGRACFRGSAARGLIRSVIVFE